MELDATQIVGNTGLEFRGMIRAGLLDLGIICLQVISKIIEATELTKRRG